MKKTARQYEADIQLLENQVKDHKRSEDLMRSRLHEANTAVEKSASLQCKMAKKLRDQTDADLLINALKAIGVIKEDEPKNREYYSERARSLMGQQQLAASAYSMGSNNLGILGGLGRPFGM